ncbi:hypothetical protein OGR47_02275 [Methylocystis sp. MJC1]|jgi:hypothetical protein|uniref:hypothetical protein n=1 Tax=Methylocystis sp. MJC1 TaxID=2654282 RepID=UPI0013EC3224|nr:hypothetical protein [Methylocystis sp. MJC1]KAF2990497.1 hypothetical protein MJC1_02259 [Methylocystis sp. MJC1]MBU6525839.1 hypothetical protein [Methylocystis sp. MJC1]UZX12306.1 hypothetical protein OGR47_02275 [Methylocystis sp. MJC1]
MIDFFTLVFGNPAQRTQSFFRGAELRMIDNIAESLPDRVEPMQLSGLGACGAVVASIALISCNQFPNAMWLVPFAMAINWFGLSVDLPLARKRQQEAAAEGMAHHLGEIFSHLSILIAYGFSPFLSVRAATAVVVCYLLFAVYGYIRAATRHVEQMAYIGIGVTEFRILLAFWPFVAVSLGVPQSLGDKQPAIDVAVLSLAGFAIIGLLTKLFLDSRKMTAASGRDD